MNFDLKTAYVGTCQACFNAQVVKATRGRTEHVLVLHGYERPGHGYINGQCWGVNSPPYELSCELTKRWKANCVECCQREGERLKKIDADGFDVYSIRVPDTAPTPEKLRLGIRTMTVNIKRGKTYTEVSRWGGKGPTHTFESARQATRKACAQNIAELVETINFLEKRIVDWRYNPEALKSHKTVKAEKRAALAETRAYRLWLRNWKSMWQYLAGTIDEHKRATKWLEEARQSSILPENLARLEAQHAEKWGHLAPFPTDKERAAARARAK